MGRIHIVIFAAFFIYGCLPSWNTSDPNNDGEAPVIAYLYHGRWIDSNQNQINIDPETIALMQKSMKEEIRNSLPGRVSKTEINYAQEVIEDKYTQLQELLIENGSIAILLDSAPPNIKEEFEWRRKAIANAINSFDTNNEATVNDRMENMFKKYDIWNRVTKIPVDNSYIQTCRSNQNKVPIPPPWPSDKWKRQKREINNKTIDILDFEFMQESLDTAVYAYKDPAKPGVCMAIVRFERGTKLIINLAFICQSDITGSACFWDNKKILSPSSDRVIKGTMPGTDPDTDLKLNLEQFANGNTLNEDCTACHRGKNAFLIHPGTLLDLPSPEYDIDPKYWYKPISKQQFRNGKRVWHNPKSTLTPPSFQDGESSCNTCHEIPELTDAYCAAVLSQAIRKTMPSPPSDPSLDRWKVHQGPYARHTRMLKSACLIFACGPTPPKGRYDICAGIRD